MFKSGDIIKGFENCEVEFYADLLKGEVIEVLDDGNSILIQVLEHKNDDNINMFFKIDNCNLYIDRFDSNNNTESIEENADIETIEEKAIKKIQLSDVQGLIDNIVNKEIDTHQHRLECLYNEKNKLMEKLSRECDNLNRVRYHLQCADSSDMHMKALSEKFLEQLNLIKSDEKCDYIQIAKNKVFIYTPKLYIEDENNPDGLFEMNKYKIEINLDTLMVRIYGLLDNYNRTSIFNKNSPHPYVSELGMVHWGNMENMIIDSIIKKEVYTTFMLVINFLESLNVDDSIGQYICNWDFISKTGDYEVLENPYSCFSSNTMNCHSEYNIDYYSNVGLDEIPF